MPHLVIEHSAELVEQLDLQQLCDRLWVVLAGHASVADTKSLRVRTLAATASRIGGENQSFAHATLLLLPGRSAEVRQEMAELVFEALQAELPQVASLTVRLDDLNPPYLKRML